MGRGVKYDGAAGKWRWSLFPPIVLKEILKVLEYGAQKYGVGNWKHLKYARQRYYDATMRHIQAWWEGERNDKETGWPHLAHAACCIIFLLYYDIKKNIREGKQDDCIPTHATIHAKIEKKQITERC